MLNNVKLYKILIYFYYSLITSFYQTNINFGIISRKIFIQLIIFIMQIDNVILNFILNHL